MTDSKVVIYAVLLAAACVAVRAMSDEMKEMAMMLHNSCRDETGADEGAIQKAQKGDIDASDSKLKCYMKCIFVQSGAMGDDGSFDADTAIGSLPPELADKIGPVIKACQGEDDPDSCMKAMKINQCFYKTSPQLFFLI